jgi:biopolymer transport protein ExbB/TolQ
MVSILTPLRDMMHNISYGLLVPTITVLMLLIAFAVFELGSLLIETFTERRRSKVNVAELLDAFQKKAPEQIRDEIVNSSLIRRQKVVLSELIKHSNLPAASLKALARKLLNAEELHYARITNRTDIVARLGPILGLMATLIPLGPGMIALGQGDTKSLADSLLTAFDATVSGLASAGVAFVISRLRKSWYEDYLSSLEAMMESLLEVLDRGWGIEEQKAQDA